MKPKTIITGCDLWIPQEGKTLHGDLWETESCWIFNGVLTEEGQAAWSYKHNEAEIGRKLIISNPAYYFERRGVVVVEKLASGLNQNAVDYVAKWRIT